MTDSATKDPNEVLDFYVDWSSRLSEVSPADTIATSSWSATNGLTVDSSTNTTTSATVWVSGGTDRKYSELTNRVVTASGRTFDHTIVVKLQHR
jgi:hypothetical protein